MSKKSIQRNPAMDIIRCFAFFFVVSVHFFLNSGYYDEIVSGPRMYIMTLMRSFFMICVPLFMVLSGYLMCNKTVNKSFYKKLTYTVSIYLLSSACCVLYRVIFLHKTFSAAGFIKGFFDYSNAPYSWYVEMYIGLFLLCPFLNLVYNNLKTKKEKQVLLATFLLLTAAPQAVNIFIPDMKWLLNPAASSNYFKILPNYWVSLYPVTYYFIGCYLREYKLKISCKTIALSSVLLFILNGMFNYYRSLNSTFIWGTWQEYSSLLVAAQTVLFFAFFDNINYSKVTAKASKMMAKISELCFGGYLLSWIFDDMFYKILNNAVSDIQLRLEYFALIVPLVCICSIILSFVVNAIYHLIALCINKLTKRRRANEYILKA